MKYQPVNRPLDLDDGGSLVVLNNLLSFADIIAKLVEYLDGYGYTTKNAMILWNMTI